MVRKDWLVEVRRGRPGNKCPLRKRLGLTKSSPGTMNSNGERDQLYTGVRPRCMRFHASECFKFKKAEVNLQSVFSNMPVVFTGYIYHLKF